MRLNELNKLVERKNFFSIKKDIDKTIDKYEDDANEVRVDHVISFDNLAKKVFDKVEKLQKDQKDNELHLGTDFDKLKKRIVSLQNKFKGYIEKYKDNEFQKELTTKLIKYLEALIAKLDDSLDDVDGVEAAMVDLEELNAEIQNVSGGKAGFKRKIPKGLAQDITTRKHKVEK